jgi:hypothetical protein
MIFQYGTIARLDREHWTSNAISVPATKVTIIDDDSSFGRPGVTVQRQFLKATARACRAIAHNNFHFLTGNFRQSFLFCHSPL